MSLLPITLIAAVARNGVIGRDGGMPWRLPGDLAHFRAATMGKPVIVGRRTFGSIGGPLPGRFIVVVSRRRTDRQRSGVSVAGSPMEAVEQADAIGAREGADAIMVAGGASIYAALMPEATSLLITAVDLRPSGDTRFPVIDADHWMVAQSTPAARSTDDEASYNFVRYARRA